MFHTCRHVRVRWRRMRALGDGKAGGGGEGACPDTETIHDGSTFSIAGFRSSISSAHRLVTTVRNVSWWRTLSDMHSANRSPTDKDVHSSNARPRLPGVKILPPPVR